MWPQEGLKDCYERDPECDVEFDPGHGCFFDNPARASSMSMGRKAAMSERDGSERLLDNDDLE